MSKHMNMLLQIVEIMVSKGFAETQEGGHELGLVWYYQGLVEYNGVKYNARYYTGQYSNETPGVELYTDSGREYAFDTSEKCQISIAMLRAFKETFHTTIEKEQE